MAVPAGTDLRFWMWNNYEIEQDWDFGFVEVSTDGGETWAQQKVYDEAGTEVTTADGYPDPNKNLDDVRRQEVRPHRQHRRLAARLRQPDPVRR